MLKSAIRYVRRQPKPVRDRYAFAVALSITAFVGLIWSVTLPERFAAVGSVAEEKNSATRPFASLWGGLKDQVASLGDAFRDVSAELSATTTATTSAAGIVLTPEELVALRARPLTPSVSTSSSTTTAPSIRIATTTTATTTATSSRTATTTAP